MRHITYLRSLPLYQPFPPSLLSGRHRNNQLKHTVDKRNTKPTSLKAPSTALLKVPLIASPAPCTPANAALIGLVVCFVVGIPSFFDISTQHSYFSSYKPLFLPFCNVSHCGPSFTQRRYSPALPIISRTMLTSAVNGPSEGCGRVKIDITDKSRRLVED
jgi:hypothetical protein